MQKLQDQQYRIPQWVLDIAIEGLQELARRLAADAAVYGKLDTPEARAMAQERLEQAQEVRKGHEFFLRL